MSTHNERWLTVLLLGFILLIAGGALGYFLVYEPYTRKTEAIQRLREEIDEREGRVAKISADRLIYDRDRKMSLPADVGMARREYERLLNGMLRKSDFSPSSISIVSRTPDSKTSPVILPKKPAYTKLDYELQVKGELGNLVDFLQAFYRQPLLHQLRRINIQRMSGATTRSANELEMNLSIEAVVLDVAEKRPMLMPALPNPYLPMLGSLASQAYAFLAVETGRGSPVEVPNMMASAGRLYQAARGKNVFTGPPPPEPRAAPVVVEEKPRDLDVAPFLCLTSIVAELDGQIVAVFFDRLNRYDYEVTQDPDGKITVQHFYYLGENRKRMRKSADLEIGSEEGGNLRRWHVKRMTPSTVILEDVEDTRDKLLRGPIPALLGTLPLPAMVGKTYRVSIGQMVGEAAKSPLLTREAREAIFTPVLLEDPGR